jgi:hypothetical protein
MAKKKLTPKQLKVRKCIDKHLTDMCALLCLQDWDIEVVLMDGVSDNNPKAVMEIIINISYLTANIAVFDPMYAAKLEDVPKSLMHELCHIITEPQFSLCHANISPHLHYFSEEMREQETERIARIAMKAYNGV